MPTLYTADRCPYAARARIVLAEKGIAYEAVEIDLGDRPAWLYEKNATGRVPVYEEDEGLVLPESEVIMEYLEERYPEPALWPADPAERALGRLWLNRFDDRLGGAYYAARRGDEGRAELDQRLAELEGALEGQPYLSGREFGLADIGYVPWILRGLERFGLELGPATADWLERCSERPGVAAERAVVSASVSLPPLVDAAWVQEHLGEEDLRARRRARAERAPARASAGLDPARARLAAAARRRARRCRSSRSRCSGGSAATASPARSGSCSTTAATASAPPPRSRRRSWPAIRRSPCWPAASPAWPGELELGAVELQKTKTSLEPRLEAVPTWEELRDRLDDPGLTILDVRSDDEYRGRGGYPCDPRQGHIPGARHLEVERLFAAPGQPHEPWGDPRARGPARRARRSSPTATRARARPSPRWRSGPPATTPATTRARGTSGRATTTCRQSAERGLPKEAPLSAKGLLVLLLGLRLQDLELVARDRGDALFATRNRQA